MVTPSKQCQAKTKSGNPCRGYATNGSRFCFTHDPAKSADRAKAHRRGGLARAIAKATEGKAAPVIANISDILLLINLTIADVWLQDNSAPRARALLAAAAEARSTLTDGEYESRFAAIEQALEMRKK